MPVYHNPSDLAPQFYSYGVSVKSPSRILFLAGQIAALEDGSVPEAIAEQTRVCFAKVRKVLACDGMTLADVTRLNYYLTKREDFAEFHQERMKELGNLKPASTLVFVSSLTQPRYRLEIEAIAAA